MDIGTIVLNPGMTLEAGCEMQRKGKSGGLPLLQFAAMVGGAGEA